MPVEALAYGSAAAARGAPGGAHASVGVYDISHDVTTLLARRADPSR